MLSLLVILVILAIVAYIARGVMAGLGAPAWMFQVLLGVILIVAIVVVANAFGIATPSLK